MPVQLCGYGRYAVFPHNHQSGDQLILLTAGASMLPINGALLQYALGHDTFFITDPIGPLKDIALS